jgi:hypothetical protein
MVMSAPGKTSLYWLFIQYIETLCFQPVGGMMAPCDGNTNPRWAQQGGSALPQTLKKPGNRTSLVNK